ncbi:MAG: polyphosphate polymerase domain-containing protein [Oscillospiraceae bacterium]|nr:polyphosphate polymerase domain-containing protein [Oscillospiraceae bacterium]
MNQTVFKRYELKFRLKRSQYQALLPLLQLHMTEDEHGKSTIQSLYFDTPTFLLARRSLEHPMYKEKLRLRSYGLAKPDSTVFIELKKKFDGVTYKRRAELSWEQAQRWLYWNGADPLDTQITREIGYCLSHYEQLRPRVLLTYRREAWYGKDDHEFRVTFDENIAWRTQRLNLSSDFTGEKLIGDDEVLMEVKVSGAIPGWLVHFLSANHIYKTSFSKYGAAYQRVLAERHFKKGEQRYA